MFLTHVSILLLLSTSWYLACAKIYQRCELAHELRNFDVPEDEIPTWVCIARYESNFDTAAMNPGSGDHGLFQISQLFWCSPPGYGCNSPCSKFRDDDIADDLQCIRRIHNEHKRISGDGFDAWVVYPLYCRGDTASYVQDCFEGVGPDTAANITDNEISTEDVDEYGDGYHFPALPTGFYKQNENRSEDLGDGYEFPQLPFSNYSIHQSVFMNGSSNVPYSEKSVTARIAKVSKQNKFLFSRVGQTGLLPYKEISIHHSKPALNQQYPKFPFSRESIHDFIPVSEESSQLRNNLEKNVFLAKFLKQPMSSSNKEHRKTECNKNKEQSNTKKYIPLGTTTLPSTLQTRSSPSITRTTISNFQIRAPTDKPNQKGLFKSNLSLISRLSKSSNTPKKVTFPLNSTTKKPLAIFPHTTEPSKRTLHKVENYFFAGASSTLSPFRSSYRTPMVTFKPMTNQKNFSVATTIKPIFASTVTTKLKSTPTVKSSAKYSSSSYPTSTTIKPTSTVHPSGRQVTFAPNSFFSWLFNSQTLPPLVPPRPPRPPNERPGATGFRPTTVKPILNAGPPRPPGPPQPSIPLARPVVEALEKPEGNPSPVVVPTRRPFPAKPHMARPFKPQQRPFAGINRKRPETGSLDGRGSPEVNVTNADLIKPVQSGRSSSEGIEIKLDDHVVFVRTKFGYRLFRN